VERRERRGLADKALLATTHLTEEQDAAFLAAAYGFLAAEVAASRLPSTVLGPKFFESIELSDKEEALVVKLFEDAAAIVGARTPSAPEP